jgi:PAS domain S-box-containing protein
LVLGYPLLKKIYRIASTNSITSIADFVGARYGKSQAVAALATVIAVIGALPYIALQLQAVTLSFNALISGDQAMALHASPGAFWSDTAFYVALIMAAFSILFGVRHVHASERHQGLILAIAFESLVKLGAFLAVGCFVTFAMFDGPSDLFRQAAMSPRLPAIFTSTRFQPEWISITVVAALAFICLPRQFHVAMVENRSRRNLRTAIWLFPIYLLTIIIFVPAITTAGLMKFSGSTMPDLFVLLLPISAHAPGLSIAVFIGGLSASTSMVIVEGVALSTMICNELAVPALIRCKAMRRGSEIATGRLILTIRRAAIFLILVAAYCYHVAVGDRYPLAAIGLISFCAVAQCAPAVLAGIYWRRAHRFGAFAGMAGGAAIWAYALLLPSLSQAGWLPPIGDGLLPPIFADIDPLTNGIIWSLLVNTALLIGTSLLAPERERDRQQALAFVGGEEHLERAEHASDSDNAALEDLTALASRILGRERAQQSFSGPVRAYRLKELMAFAERVLSGAVGAASARIMVAAALRRHDGSTRTKGTLLNEASEAILYHRDLLRATLENVGQGIAMFDPQRRLAAWNHRLCELLGVREALAQFGTPLAEIVDDPVRQKSSANIDLAMLANQEPLSDGVARTYQRRRADGRVLELQTNPMAAGGFVLVCTDITESMRTMEALRDSESRIRVYTDNVPVLITYVDREERYRFTNEPYQRALGHRGANVIGKTILQVLGPERYQRLKPHIDAALTGQRRSFEIEFPHSGIEIAQGTYIPHVGDSGEVVGFFTLYQDITERRRAEQVLREANEILEQRVAERTSELTSLNTRLADAKLAAEAANLGKTRFLAAASHDLLQPLHVARLLTGTLEARSRTSKTISMARQIDQALGTIDDLLQALLEISKLDAGATRPQLRSTSLRDLLQSLALSFEPIARQRGLELHIVEPSLTVMTDPTLLRRILQNFLSNAVCYTRTGRILVGCRRHGDRVTIEVWDTGIGIPEDQLEVIFEEFRRGTEDADCPPGLGLGLAIVERIGKVLDHRVAVRSWPGRGSVFSVSLPLGAPSPAVTPQAQTRSRNSVSGKQVLCIDNEPSVLAAMRALLEGWSCGVVTAVNVAAARRELREGMAVPDAILMDFHLEEEFDGLSALDALAADVGKPVPAILITANYTDAVRDRARARGYAVLHKPVRPGALRAAIAQLTLAEARRSEQLTLG